MILPKLYQKSSTGKLKVWEIEVVGEDNHEPATIKVTHGYIDGKQQTETTVISKGKNVGKANETTPYQQACKDAQSKWNNKKDRKGYSENQNYSEEKAPYIRPMLAVDYKKRKKSIKYPAFTQMKIDGLRNVSYVKDDKVINQSREGIIWDTLDHLNDDITFLYNEINKPLDGEIYIPGVKLQHLNKLLKKKRIKEEERVDGYLTEDLQYYIFDYIDEDVNFNERNIKLYEAYLRLIESKKLTNIVFVPSVEVKDEKEVMDEHEDYITVGYEGTIIRNNVPYRIGKRTADLQKYKDFEDDEFEIIGGFSGTGREQDAVIYICKTKDNVEFEVRPKGSIPDRIKALKNINNDIGKMLNCKFRGYTADGKPIHCTGNYIREFK